MINKKFLLILVAAIVAACSDSGDDNYAEKPVHAIYNEGYDLVRAEKYDRAAKVFAEVERQHPYSDWAMQAQLMSGYASYQARKYDDAIETFNVFIQLHPGHPKAAYAHYMVGLCRYEQIPITERDQKDTEEALQAFNEVIQRFPTSKYAKDAKYKLTLVRDHLAAKEMDVGRFYLGQQNYLAALNRFQFVAKTFQTSTHVPEALHRMVECYLSLGILDQAVATASVLGHNYAKSTWYQESYNLVRASIPEDALKKLQARRPTSTGAPLPPPAAKKHKKKKRG